MKKKPRCPICGRLLKEKDPRRTLPGNPKKHNHGFGGAIHED